MPRKGYSAVTVSNDVYERILKVMEKENEKAGYKKFRSISHFVEYCFITQYGNASKEDKKRNEK